MGWLICASFIPFSQLDYLNGEKSQLSAKVATLTEDISTLASEIANLSRDRGDAGLQRARNHEENTKAIAEAQEAQKVGRGITRRSPRRAPSSLSKPFGGP